MKLRMGLSALVWALFITLLHVQLNVGWGDLASKVRVLLGQQRAELRVGFLPVTCHLTCPVTSWITTHSEAGSIFRSRKFTDFATVKEALISREIEASFILAPLAMQLARDGIPIKIVYLGHRDGTALVVRDDSDIRTFQDLRGRIVAIPSRFSNQNVLMRRKMRDEGMPPGSIDLRELPPPEHPAALYARSIDGYIVGEPFAAKAEVDGFGRVLYQAKDIWPNFISCVLVVRTDVIDEERELVQELVDGIAKSGKWLDQDPAHRLDAAEVAGKHYYFQPPELLAYVLSKPPDRVRYTELGPLREDFDEIMELAVEIGVLDGPIAFEDYVDDSFVRPLDEIDWNLDRLPHAAGVASEATQ